MNIKKDLGKLIQCDRELAGLTQDQLAKKLNKMTDRPIDPYTKKPKRAHRTWIAKLESGKMRRELRIEIRQWFAKALNGDNTLYQNLSVKPEGKESVNGDLDVLPLMKYVVKSKRTNFTFDEWCRLCEAHERCLEIGLSLIDPISEGTLLKS